jgi:hypothetical protein
METAERLIVREGTPPATADGKSLGCVMKVTSGNDGDVQWFVFKTSYVATAPTLRVEWDVETMDVVIPAETANWLIKNGYARAMTASEARAYNNGLGKEAKETDE